jgi:cysteine desulfurase family protein
MIYLNNAATSYPKPDSVIKAVENYCRQPPFHAERSGSSEDHADVAAQCRRNLCRLFNADSPDNIILTSSATHSLNLVLRGLLQKGDHVVTTQAEHNSVLRIIKTLEKQDIISTSIVACNKKGYVDPDDIKNSLLKNTKLVIVNHCSNVTGTFQDIKKTGNILKEHEAVFVVDAAQSAGAASIDVQETGIDALAFAGHKSLFGIQGVGGLYIRKGIDPEPLIIGGTGVKSDYLLQPPGRPGYYEAGTPNMPGIVSLNAGVSYILGKGLPAINQKKTGLRNILLEFLLNEKNIVVYGGSQLGDFTENEAVVSFNIKGISPEETGYILEESFGIVCRSGLHCAPLIHKAIGSYPQGCVRISFSCFNKKKEVDSLINAVTKIIKVK